MTKLPSEMLASRISRFGGPEVLEIVTLPVPTPGPGEVLVQVHAAGVGPWDAWVRSGRSALPQPLPLTPGADLAGTIVDPGDSGYACNETVFGVTNARFVGAQAQYAIAEASRLAHKPAGLSFVEAAAAPVIAVTAWSMLFELGGIELGQRVLIHGGAGNVGALAVQMAKRAGAQVVATCFGADVDRVRALGADEVVDIQAGPFPDTVKYADLVIDTVGGVTQTASFDVLVPGGQLVSSVSPPDQDLAKDRHVTAKFFLVDVTRQKLEAIAPLLTGGLKLAIGEVLRLEQVQLAHEMLGGAPHRAGKIVLEA